MEKSWLPGIKKLTGRDNYSTWKFGMEMFLTAEDLWCAVTDKPKDEQADSKAKAKICLMIDESLYPIVRGCKTSTEVWVKLESTYEDKGLSRRLSLLRKLFRIQLSDFPNMEEYLNEILSLSQKLEFIGAGLDDEFIGVIMLSGLTDEFEPMIMAMESTGVKTDSDYIRSTLIQKVAKTDKGDETALTTKPHRNNKPSCFKCKKLGHKSSECKSNSAPNSSVITCYNCNKKGHKSSECWYRDNQKGGAKQKVNKATLLAALSSVTTNPKEWIIDSGATSHMTNQKAWMNNTRKEEQEITVANNEKISSESIGTVNLDNITVSEVLYVPDLSSNLISVSKAANKGYKIVFDNKECKVYESCHVRGKEVITAKNCGGVYKIVNSEVANLTNSNLTKKLPRNLWHRRLGHMNRKYMDKLKDMTTGMDFVDKVDNDCIICVKGKQCRELYNKNRGIQSRDILELIHSDLCGKMSVPSWGGANYVFTLTDDFSRKTFIYLLEKKSDAFDKFKEFKKLVENQTGKKIKTLRTDNGREYVNHNFKNFLKNHGIIHQLTAPYSPPQNGVSERLNRTLMEKARCMLEDANLDRRYWGEAINTAVYLKNRSPTKAIKNMLPEEIWTGRKVNVSYLRTFGCKAMRHIPDMLRKKLDTKSQECIFVGYSNESKAYRLVDPRNPKKIIISRDVKFFEDYIRDNLSSKEEDQETNEITPFPLTKSERTPTTNENPVKVEKDDSAEHSSEEEDFYGFDSDPNTGEEEVRMPLRRSTRIKKPKVFPNHEVYIAKCDENETPVEELLTGPDGDKWKTAIQCELDSLIKNKSFEVVNPPCNKKILKSRWVMKVKDPEGQKIYKARLVIKGCGQVYGRDYEETFSPVAKYSSIRYLMSCAAQQNWKIDHMDIVTAYLYGELEEDIYVIPPPEAIKEGDEGKAWKLTKSIYGLKQSGRCWNKKLHQVLIDLGFCQSKADPCIYILNKDGANVILAVYVDDILIFYNNDELVKYIKLMLKKNFDTKDLGKIKKCLGMEITQDEKNGKISISQKSYINQILKRFKMENAKTVTTPMDLGINLEEELKKEEDEERLKKIPYQEAVGSLLYLSQISRPDITFAVNFLSRFNNSYGEAHWTAVKRVFRYIKGTIDYRLEYRRNENDLHAYCDADWGNKINDRYSVSGYCFISQGGAISWCSKKQKTVALSTCEAEYMSISVTIQECLWLKTLISEVNPSVTNNTITINCDNTGAIELTKNNVVNQRSKHIDIRHHFIREHITKNNVNIKYVPTEENISDFLTKPLNKVKHIICVQGTGLI